VCGQNRIFEIQRFTRLQDEPTMVQLTGNILGFFNNYTLLDNVRARYLRDELGGLFTRQGKVMQIPFMAADDEDMFAAAIYFNFTPKGVQLADFHPEGRGQIRRLHDVEVCIKHLQAFWEMAYVTTDEDGPVPIAAVWDPLLRQLDTSTLLQILSPEYIVAVIDMALKALAARLDSVSPGGVRIAPRGWWVIIGEKLRGLTFSRENQEYYELVHGKRGRTGGKPSGVISAPVVTQAPAKPPVMVAGGGLGVGSKPAAVVKDGGGGPVGGTICFLELRHHFNLPAGAVACPLGKDCARIHPGKYKSVPLDKVVTQLMSAKGDYKDAVQVVVENREAFGV
jgi:hypothetical protein